MNVLGVGAPAPTSLSSSALHFRLKVTNILPPSPFIILALCVMHDLGGGQRRWAAGAGRAAPSTSALRAGCGDNPLRYCVCPPRPVSPVPALGALCGARAAPRAAETPTLFRVHINLYNTENRETRNGLATQTLYSSSHCVGGSCETCDFGPKKPYGLYGGCRRTSTTCRARECVSLWDDINKGNTRRLNNLAAP